MAKRAAVIICDRSRLFREGLASLLQQSQFRIQTVYSDFEELQQKLGTSTKGPLVLIGAHSAADVDMQAIAHFKEAHPGCHVVILINSCSEEQRWQAAHYGLDGVLLKSISTEVLCLSLELVLKSQSVFIVNSDSADELASADMEMARPVASNGSDGLHLAGHLPQESLANALADPGLASGPGPTTMISSRREGLSDRELEILDCLVNGHSNKVIARRCNITEATVKVHLKAILRKISVANRTQAAVWAINKMHRASALSYSSRNLNQPGFDASRQADDQGEKDEPDPSSQRGASDPPPVLALLHTLSGAVVPGAH